MIRQVDLVEKVKKYDAGADEDAINRAYVFATKAHGAQLRESGDAYFLHPLEVAGILTDYRLDSASIITALLHDTIEDTPHTLAEVESHFGAEVARLVDGVTKLTRIELLSDHTKQAENFRKLVLAMSDDIRVLLIKLADRLHNMRTLHFVNDAGKRKRIGIETMEIFAPLAERIGLHDMKNEMEDLAFNEINSEARHSIVSRLEFLREQSGDVAARVTKQLESTLANAGVKAAVLGREKRPYSIWRKMQSNNMAFEQLSDIIAFRVIVDFTEDCYRALGVIHCAYRMVPGRFNDYISTPKPNGYRSLHTDVIGPERQKIEVQIRTREMHEVAEHGVAAHWIYKQNAVKTDGRQYRWLRELLDILDQAMGPEEFLEHTKLEMFEDQVFCFTPRGELISLPQKATPLDFAYAVHSEIGDCCVGAKINGKMMPLRTHLHNGDQVEILTSKVQTPSPAWERIVVTGKARARIRRFVHSKEREQYIKLGSAILKRAFQEEGFEYADKAPEGVCKVFKQNSGDDLCAAVGAGLHTGREVLEAIFPGIKKINPKERKAAFPTGVNGHNGGRKKGKRKESGGSIPISGLVPGMAVHYAECCHPLPGDRIVGVVTSGKGATIHTIDCASLESDAGPPEDWLDVSWDVDGDSPVFYVGRIFLTVLNEPGSLGNLSMVIAKSKGNISNLKITNHASDFFDMTIDIEVKDVKHLTDIIAALRANPVINSVERAREVEKML